MRWSVFNAAYDFVRVARVIPQCAALGYEQQHHARKTHSKPHYHLVEIFLYL